MRCMVIIKANQDSEAGVMPEMEDFGAEFPPEPREQEERQRAQMAAKQST